MAKFLRAEVEKTGVFDQLELGDKVVHVLCAEIQERYHKFKWQTYKGMSAKAKSALETAVQMEAQASLPEKAAATAAVEKALVKAGRLEKRAAHYWGLQPQGRLKNCPDFAKLMKLLSAHEESLMM